MKKAIKTYEDLLQEEQRLKGELDSYKVLIKEDIQGLKEALNPVKRVVATARRIFTRDDNGPLINFGLNFGVDFILKKVLLARTGWIFKFLVPYVVKNYASHIVGDEERDKIAKTIKRLLKKLNFKKAKHEFESAVS
jgi:predicted RNA binding protein with dsRBD fold (UPF0201 family)